MSARVRTVEYFYIMVKDRPGEAYRLLSHLATEQVNLLAFNAIPMGLEHTQLVLFPDSSDLLSKAAAGSGLTLTGPQRALLVQDDDRLGALADIHLTLLEANINVYASSGVTDGRGGYGYILYLRPEDFRKAAHVLSAA
jgi:hypothetical protein